MLKPNGTSQAKETRKMAKDIKETETGGNVGDFMQAPASQRKFHVRLIGTTPLKPDRMSDEQIIEALIRRKRKQPDTEAALEDMAEESLYRGPDGKPGIPADNVLASFRDAGTKIKWGASKSNVTKADGKTMLFAFLSIDQSFLTLLDVPKGGEKNEGWKVDIKLGKMQDPKRTAVGIVRPRFDEWALEFDMTITYIGPEVTNAIIGKLINMAGMAQGLCAHRPSCGGRFGTFKLDSIVEIPMTNQQAQTAAA
jgi:hypothetical protein